MTTPSDVHAALEDGATWPWLRAPEEDPASALIDPGRRRLVVLRDEVWAELAAGVPRPAALDRLRTEAYRVACHSWEDAWTYRMVAWSEEAVAESERLSNRPGRASWDAAWSAWRTAWWIRRTAGAPPEQQRHHDLVLAILDARTGRLDSARERLAALLSDGSVADDGRVHRVWQAVSRGDAS